MNTWTNNLEPTLIKQLHETEALWHLALTGGGTSAIGELFAAAGASSTILDVQVPYHENALQRFLRTSQSQGCNRITARAMAVESFLRAKELMPGKQVFGLGCTAAIATQRERKGQDRCYLAVQGEKRTCSADLIFDKSTTRETQETECRKAILYLMARESGIVMEEIDELLTTTCEADQAWQDLLMGRTTMTECPEDLTGVMPGAFNPLHDGHNQILRKASELLDGPVALEISINNVDKPTLDYLTMQERAKQGDNLRLIFSNAPTFQEKAQAFPGVTFIVGIDTLVRIQEPRYYENIEARDDALKVIKNQNNRFLVFGRKINGAFQTLDDVKLVPGLRELCTGVDENEFRADISSTELRSD